MKKREGYVWAACLFFLLLPRSVFAMDLKLPYAAGEEMILTRGYNTAPTHVKGDSYALDFTQSGCEGHGKPIVASDVGTVSFIGPAEKANVGYGLNVIVEHESGITSRYGHMHGYGDIEVGAAVGHGSILGYQGNTGNVAGAACPEYPGTHIHLVLKENGVPYKPEPMSGFTDFTAGTWYLSDNATTKKFSWQGFVDYVSDLFPFDLIEPPSAFAEQSQFIEASGDEGSEEVVENVLGDEDADTDIDIVEEKHVEEIEDHTVEAKKPEEYIVEMEHDMDTGGVQEPIEEKNNLVDTEKIEQKNNILDFTEKDPPFFVYPFSGGGGSSSWSQSKVEDIKELQDTVSVENEISSGISEPAPEESDIEEQEEEEVPLYYPPDMVSLTVEKIYATSTQFALSWQATSSLPLTYAIAFRENNDEWIALATSTTATTWIHEGGYGSVYTFRVRAKDTDNIISEWMQHGDDAVISDWSQEIVINEIAWMGTSPVKNLSVVCPEHEWIELFNRTSNPIDLNGWSLVVSGVSHPLSGVLDAGSYYLAVQKQGKKIALKNISYNLELDREALLRDEGDRILLLNDGGRIIDEVNFQSGWPAGEKTAGRYRPMARRDDAQFGSTSSAWMTDHATRPRGATNNCGRLFGSPGTANNGYWLLTQLDTYYAPYMQSSTLRLTREQSPYIFSAPTEIPEGVRLEVEPGVELIPAHSESSFVVQGEFALLGSEALPIQIHSAASHATGTWAGYLGNVGAPAAPGDWANIVFMPGSVGEIQYTDIRDGGRTSKLSSDGLFASVFVNHVISAMGSSLSIDHATFSHHVMPSAPGAQSATIWSAGIFTHDAHLSLTHSQLSGGYSAVSFFGEPSGPTSTLTLFGNVFEEYQAGEKMIFTLDLTTSSVQSDVAIWIGS